MPSESCWEPKLWAIVLSIGVGTGANADILVQSTTSTANSGLYDHILPAFEEFSGDKVNVVAVGTGQAIRNAVNCDGDVLLVHAKEAEEAFVASGAGVERFDLMYNDFIVVGPKEDPAGIGGMADVKMALKDIATSEAVFLSRGDDSGTHKKEMALWADAGEDPSTVSGTWYRETGSGMGATLNAGVAMGGYVMTDRATWMSFGNKQGHEVLVEGDPDLFNQYGVILVNPAACSDVNAEGGQRFIDWLTSDAGQNAIASFEIDGQQLFFPNAARAE